MKIEKLTTLALSVYSNKGAYALLLGSGISRRAHIPTGWEVESRLIERIAATQGIFNEEDWHQWFINQYGKEANYSDLLEEMVKTPTERVRLMQNFFEPTTDEKELGWKLPTKAHRAIANLIREGYVKVVVTTNFDRLLEHALEEIGVHPQVIKNESDWNTATPIIHSKEPTIIKVNGDYLDCQFRNTTKELDDYPQILKGHLHGIFSDFGLVTCGWSAKWDKGLIKIITESQQPRYTSFFAEVGTFSEELQNLSESRDGELLRIIGADEMFTSLLEQVQALEKVNVSRTMSHDFFIAKIKKFLSSDNYSIEYADLIETLGRKAYDTIQEHAHYNFTLSVTSFLQYAEIHKEAVAPLIDAFTLAARWGKYEHIAIFKDILIKLCLRPFENGRTESINTSYIHALAVEILFYAIGVACVKYERFKELEDILSLEVPPFNFVSVHPEKFLSIVGMTHWDKDLWNALLQQNYYYPRSIVFKDTLKPFFKNVFYAESEFENYFYIWEQILSLSYVAHGCCWKGREYFPTGDFVRAASYYRYQEFSKNTYWRFFDEAEKVQDNWKPLKYGMFGSDYQKYKRLYDNAQKYYSNNWISG